MLAMDLKRILVFRHRTYVWGLFFYNNFGKWELIETSVNQERIENMKKDNAETFHDPERYRVGQVLIASHALIEDDRGL